MSNIIALLPAFLASIPILLLTLGLPTALVILLQVLLCQRWKWLGLILPCLTLLFSLVIIMNIAPFHAITEGGAILRDEQGNIIQQTVPEQEDYRVEVTSVDLFSAALLFLVFNIPTAVLGGIWLHCRNKKEWREDLRRMNIQDLE